MISIGVRLDITNSVSLPGALQARNWSGECWKENLHSLRPSSHSHSRHPELFSPDDFVRPRSQTTPLFHRVESIDLLQSSSDDISLELPDNVFLEHRCLTFLRECLKLKALAPVRRLHTYIFLLTSQPSILLQEHLVLSFAKLGGLDDAFHMFNRLLRRTVFSWTAMISGYAEFSRPCEAIDMYQHMLEEGVKPDRFTFISLFQACGSIGNLEQGKQLHLEAQRQIFSSNTYVGNALISMYGKCGAIWEAEDVFYELAVRSVVSWTAMISVYVDNNQAEKGLQLYRQMQAELVSPNDQTFVCAIQACSSLAEMESSCSVVDEKFSPVKILDLVQALHVDAWRAGFTLEIYVATTLISAYGKLGAITEAETTFTRLPKQNVASYTAMISTYGGVGNVEKALLLYRQMLGQGIHPNEQTLVCTLRICDAVANTDGLARLGNKTKALKLCKALHGDAHLYGCASGDIFGNALLSIYGKHGTIEEAEIVFLELHHRGIVSWTAMLSVYIEQGKPEKALQVYKQMHEEGLNPNQQTLVMALQACGALAEKEESIDMGQQLSFRKICLEICQLLHVDARTAGIDDDVFVGSALLSLYSKCRVLSQAEEVFRSLPCKDIGSWNAMLSVYLQQGQGSEALRLYECMLDHHVVLDNITFLNAMQACSETSSSRLCMQLHFSILSSEHVSDVSLASSLLRTYGKCANIMDAVATLLAFPQPDCVLCNACIASYAEGNSEASWHIFEESLLWGLQPDGVTFASVLSACNYAGFIEEGLKYYQSMKEDYSLNPDSMHFAGLIDLLGRAGDFKRMELANANLEEDGESFCSV